MSTTDTAPSCPKADDRFDVDTVVIIAKFAGGSVTYAPELGGGAKPDYIPETITVGVYTKCLIHTDVSLHLARAAIGGAP